MTPIKTDLKLPTGCCENTTRYFSTLAILAHSIRHDRIDRTHQIFVSCQKSKDTDGNAIPATRRILKGFPNSQHRPIIIEVGLKIPIIRADKRNRWNFTKANWEIFSQLIEKTIFRIPAYASSYDRFVGLVTSAAKRSIQRGHRDSHTRMVTNRRKPKNRMGNQNGISQFHKVKQEGMEPDQSAQRKIPKSKKRLSSDTRSNCSEIGRKFKRRSPNSTETTSKQTLPVIQSFVKYIIFEFFVLFYFHKKKLIRHTPIYNTP